MWHSVRLATYTAAFPNHSSAKHRYGFREKFQISLEITRKFLSGNSHYRSKSRALPPASLLCSRCLNSSGKEELFHGVFPRRKKLENTDLQNCNRVVRAQVTYNVRCQVYDVLRASCNEHCRQDNNAMLSQRCDTTHRTTKHSCVTKKG